MADDKKNNEKSIPDQIKEEPFITLPLQAYKARRNLLTLSLLCLARWHGLKLTDAPKIFDAKLGGWNGNLFVWVLFVVTAYFLSYFLLLSWTTLEKWRLRSTGLPQSKANKLGGTLGGGRLDPEIQQSTAWIGIDMYFQRVDKFLSDVPSWEEMQQQVRQIAQNEATMKSQFVGWEKAIGDLKRQQAEFTIQMKPVLMAFEKDFWKHQSLSFLTHYRYEIVLPIILGTMSLLALLWHIVTPLLDP